MSHLAWPGGPATLTCAGIDTVSFDQGGENTVACPSLTSSAPGASNQQGCNCNPGYFPLSLFNPPFFSSLKWFDSLSLASFLLFSKAANVIGVLFPLPKPRYHGPPGEACTPCPGEWSTCSARAALLLCARAVRTCLLRLCARCRCARSERALTRRWGQQTRGATWGRRAGAPPTVARPRSHTSSRAASASPGTRGRLGRRVGLARETHIVTTASSPTAPTSRPRPSSPGPS